ncbi:hypothetical protein LUZ60_003313 [Juncus effusus]|nr:hypothetical protein LUZ60_003313 [Juncus effusus]
MPLFFLKTESNTSKTASDFKTNLDRYVVKKAAASFKTFFKHAFTEDPILKRLKEAVKAIDGVAADVEVFSILVKKLEKEQQKMDKNIMRGRETSSVLNVETKVFGRDEVKEEIVKKLLNPGYQHTAGNFCVLPIVGVGGMGKTTLAQFVYNDQRVVDHFKLRMWVCISKPFDVVLLTKKLYESVFKKKADFDNFESVHRKLAEKLQSKKFLIVFDDAWNDSDTSGWQKLLAPLKSGDKGSMILLTTRMEEVAKTIGRNVMHPIFLKGLKKDEYWNLFVQCAFGDEIQNNDKKLEKIGRDNVQKLKGSPLAAKTIGAVLRSNLNEKHWRNVLERERWWSPKNQNNDIMPALSLSYQHLDSHLKPCFSFCSLFPQDHKFNKEDLIYMWMAVGLVPRYGDGKKRPENIGSEFFDELVNKSFLEKSTFGYYVMHDLLHDLATFVSNVLDILVIALLISLTRFAI